jgi:hypothetical protein
MAAEIERIVQLHRSSPGRGARTDGIAECAKAPIRYLLVTHIPFARNGAAVELDSLWLRDLEGLRDSIGQSPSPLRSSLLRSSADGVPRSPRRPMATASNS